MTRLAVIGGPRRILARPSVTQGCSVLLDDAYVGQNSVEAEGIVVERFCDVGHTTETQNIEGKAAHTGKDAGVVADAAAVFVDRLRKSSCICK
jgi:hypothetical protein